METAAVQLVEWMQPRNHRAATKVLSAFATVGVAVTVALYPLSVKDSRTDLLLVAVAGLALVLIGAMSLAARFFDEATRPAWAVCPFLAVVAIVVVDLATYDASLSAQIFFLLPTLYGASQLPRQGAVLITGASVLGDAVVVAANLPVREAVTDGVYMAAALVAAATMLVRGAEDQAVMTGRLERRATTDSLTGLVTRRVFDKATDLALSSAQGAEGPSLALIDVDLFKSVNDRFGHQGGDDVLVEISTLMTRASRGGDVVARLGGDELAILLPDCSLEIAVRRAEDLVATVLTHEFVLRSGEVVPVSVSAGVAHAPDHASDFHGLYAAADAALYAAKREGRGRVVTHRLSERP